VTRSLGSVMGPEPRCARGAVMKQADSGPPSRGLMHAVRWLIRAYAALKECDERPGCGARLGIG
jgi:hypothetical protein